jgi:tRNA1Val (adenine37-N6)-methyltransferase
MANDYFQFKQFTIWHQHCAMKVTTDACLLGALPLPSSLPNRMRILDIGTGTGLLSLMKAQLHPESTIDAIEIDPLAAAQAADNAAKSPFANRIQVMQSDARLFKPLELYDAIICNAPFHEGQLASGTHAKDLAHHSTELTYAQVLNLAAQWIHNQGVIALLLPHYRTRDVYELAAMQALSVTKQLEIRQHPSKAFFRTILYFSRQVPANTVEIESLDICDANFAFTPAFHDLLRPFYLKL